TRRRQAEDHSALADRQPHVAGSVDRRAVGNRAVGGTVEEHPPVGDAARRKVVIVGEYGLPHRICVVEGAAVRREARPVAERNLAVELDDAPVGPKRVEPARRLFRLPMAGTEHEAACAIDLAVGQLDRGIGRIQQRERRNRAAGEIERVESVGQRDDRPTRFAQGQRTDQRRHRPPAVLAARRVPADHALLEDIDVVQRLLGDVPHRSLTDAAARQLEPRDPHRRSLPAMILTGVTIGASLPQPGGAPYAAAPWQCLYVFPDPHGQGALRLISAPENGSSPVAAAPAIAGMPRPSAPITASAPGDGLTPAGPSAPNTGSTWPVRKSGSSGRSSGGGGGAMRSGAVISTRVTSSRIPSSMRSNRPNASCLYSLIGCF